MFTGFCITAAILFVILAIAGNYFYTAAIVPGGYSKLIKPRKPSEQPLFDDNLLWWARMPQRILQLRSRDGFLLQGYYIENKSKSDRLVILAHGYGGRAAEMAVYARIYYDLGFNVFAPDNRAHGKSEGKAIGMGWLDRDDYLLWLDLLNSRADGKSQIILHGHSMGGAIVSILSGEPKLPVCGIVSDCSYDSAKNMFKNQIKKLFHLPPFPLIPISSLVCKIRAGYFFGEANAVKRVANSRTPMLFIHGGSDSLVPCDMVNKLYNAADPALRDIWIVGGAKHIESVKLAPDEYRARIKNFTEKVLYNR